jgi:hypothetical protein
MRFASAHIIHIGLVAWLCWIGDAPAVATFVFFGGAIFSTYLLAICSIGRVREALSRSRWWLVRTLGLNYILYAFAVDFLGRSPSNSAKYILGYLPFSILVIVGPLLRITAMALNFGRRWRDYRFG